MCLSDLTGFSKIIFILSLLVTHLIVVDFIAHIWLTFGFGVVFRFGSIRITYMKIFVFVFVCVMFFYCVDWIGIG